MKVEAVAGKTNNENGEKCRLGVIALSAAQQSPGSHQNIIFVSKIPRYLLNIIVQVVMPQSFPKHLFIFQILDTLGSWGSVCKGRIGRRLGNLSLADQGSPGRVLLSTHVVLGEEIYV